MIKPEVKAVDTVLNTPNLAWNNFNAFCNASSLQFYNQPVCLIELVQSNSLMTVKQLNSYEVLGVQIGDSCCETARANIEYLTNRNNQTKITVMPITASVHHNLNVETLFKINERRL